MKTGYRVCCGLVFATIYTVLFFIAYFSTEPLGVLFVDGINTFISLVYKDIFGSYLLYSLPINFILGNLEWFFIGYFVIPGLIVLGARTLRRFGH